VPCDAAGREVQDRPIHRSHHPQPLDVFPGHGQHSAEGECQAKSPPRCEKPLDRGPQAREDAHSRENDQSRCQEPQPDRPGRGGCRAVRSPKLTCQLDQPGVCGQMHQAPQNSPHPRAGAVREPRPSFGHTRRPEPAQTEEAGRAITQRHRHAPVCQPTDRDQVAVGHCGKHGDLDQEQRSDRHAKYGSPRPSDGCRFAELALLPRPIWSQPMVS
jgi:hypothetical protein